MQCVCSVPPPWDGFQVTSHAARAQPHRFSPDHILLMHRKSIVCAATRYSDLQAAAQATMQIDARIVQKVPFRMETRHRSRSAQNRPAAIGEPPPFDRNKPNPRFKFRELFVQNLFDKTGARGYSHPQGHFRPSRSRWIPKSLFDLSDSRKTLGYGKRLVFQTWKTRMVTASRLAQGKNTRISNGDPACLLDRQAAPGIGG